MLSPMALDSIAVFFSLFNGLRFGGLRFEVSVLIVSYFPFSTLLSLCLYSYSSLRFLVFEALTFLNFQWSEDFSQF